MPAVGKSTLGVVLAKAVAKSFVDTDLVIQQAAECTLQHVLDTQGFQALRDLEEKVVLATDFSDAVIATGGSVVYSDECMRKLKSLGPVVYLKASLDDIIARLNNYDQRGIASPGGMSLADIYAERTPLYEQYADIVCDTSAIMLRSKSPVETAVDDILSQLSWKG